MRGTFARKIRRGKLINLHEGYNVFTTCLQRVYNPLPGRLPKCVEDVKRFDHKAMPALALRDAENLGHLKYGGYKGSDDKVTSMRADP